MTCSPVPINDKVPELLARPDGTWPGRKRIRAGTSAARPAVGCVNKCLPEKRFSAVALDGRLLFLTRPG